MQRPVPPIRAKPSAGHFLASQVADLEAEIPLGGFGEHLPDAVGFGVAQQGPAGRHQHQSPRQIRRGFGFQSQRNRLLQGRAEIRPAANADVFQDRGQLVQLGLVAPP